MNHRLHITTAALLLLGSVGTSHGYRTFAAWGSASQNMRASAVSFPVGGTYRTPLSTAISRWNSNPSNFNWTLILDEPNVGTGNTQNEIWFTPGTASDPPAETLTTLWPLSGNLMVTDIIFYTASGTSWTASMTYSNLLAYGGTNRPFEPAAIHELGHALGLDHEAGEYNVMGTEYTHIHMNNGTCRSYVGEDASDGAVALYGTNGSAGQDVSVVHWKYSGSSGGYSTHALTQIFVPGTNTVKSSTAFEGQRRYIINRGDSVDVEFTFENNGRSEQSPNVAFYLSGDKNIQTSDTLLTTRRPTLGRGDVYTTRYTITIPAGTAVARYYLGAYVDYDNLINEFDGINNTASIPVDIR